MSRPGFPADHDLNEHILDGLLRREPAVEVVRVRDAGLADRPDHEILEYAARGGWLVVSHDVNTMPGHAYARLEGGQAVAGLFMVRPSQPIGPVMESLLLIWSASEAEEWQNQVCFLPL
jgi:hypothetical protein